MELSYLRHFHEVAKQRSFTRAAKSLRIGQPAISRAVKKMEEDLGVTLFDRQKRSVTLTAAGERIFEACTRLFQERENIDLIAASEKNECRGPLKFGAANPISTFVVPKVHKSFLKQHPDVWPMTFSGPAEAILSRIADGELEFGLFFHLPKLATGLEASILAETSFELVIAAAKARDAQVRQSFIGSREVDDLSNKAFPTLERLRRDHPQARIRISSNDLFSHKEMALAGLGVAILPRFMVAAELKAEKLVAVYPRERFVFPLRLVQRKGKILSRAAKQYLEELALLVDCF